MSGLVSLVGAGPGDPDLLTVKGLRRLQEADAVVYDRLVNESLLSLAPDSAQRIDVGKMPHHHPVKQPAINEMLGSLAAQGKRVVRLQSGDPFVFGRGGEELAYLRERHIAVEVVPGITSAVAGPGAVGIPVTHRDFASSFHVITGHHKSADGQPDWPTLAHAEGTLIFVMGMETLPSIVAGLIANGKSPATPTAVVQRATWPNQRAVSGDLAHIVQLVAANGIGAPSVIVVGEVVALMNDDDSGNSGEGGDGNGAQGGEA
ncbi:MAG: uroporphyrinogen-III C-methyltransferase [Bifidobacterium subtile]|jgi:uroporphyrinogen III methyltransferase/synthase|nr:uroporphyrinogen-III C-methyltransferase [Bifidobacterium subtile]MCI1258661.1 uroporphyrinogen-III C-methyltransferase [Bifidobacterium subtile]